MGGLLIKSQFRPTWWLKSPHLQTFWPVFFARQRFEGRKERFDLPDGDFVDLVWGEGDGPLVMVVHGLEGSIDSHYAAAMMNSLQMSGYSAVFMHLRGCSGEPNRFDRAYHSGDTADISAVAAHVVEVTGKSLQAMVGYSLGANAMLKWLGEAGSDATPRSAVAVSIPFRLELAAKRLQQGGSRIYQSYLLRKMRAAYQRKFDKRPSPLDIDVADLKDFFQFDDQVTAPLHGFDGVDDYYRRSSCRQYLGGIRKRTLIIHSSDDPFMYPYAAPEPEELSEHVTLELTQHGGHVGFITGGLPQRWLEKRIIEFLKSDEPPVGH
ncbi:alpha/beta hydrolase [Solemya velum gill symbiont]|uniref:hydrolase n=1 Tax=Solemya velum gill symbiont TaxID=2340 RepID=UPI0009971B14|nr:hydrolase [Solemya velum gill symbiont]OOZ80173.1 alpha/beta hydrolase [Solemya velum gill symbiont]